MNKGKDLLNEPIQIIDTTQFVDNMKQPKSYANNLAGLNQFMLDNGMIENGELDYSDAEDKTFMIESLEDIFGEDLVNQMLGFLNE